MSIDLDCVVAAGEHRGVVIALRAVSLHALPIPAREPLDLLGMPCRLVVEGGTPRLEA